MITKDFQKCVIEPGATLADALYRLNASALKICLVVEPNGRLAGILTDGDIRRALLQNVPLGEPARNFMNRKFAFLQESAEAAEVYAQMRMRNILHLPLLDRQGCIRALGSMLSAAGPSVEQVQVVLMAGGEGKRLRPLTESCPKPLLELNGKPILERIITMMRGQGFRRFTISLNYLADMIVDYFGDGAAFGVRIDYIRERQPKGTGGALSLIEHKDAELYLVMNGDLITDLFFPDLIRFHHEHEAMATMCAVRHRYQIPFGVVDFDIERSEFFGMREKPTYHYYLNSGIYCIHPRAVDLVPKDEFFDMPDLFGRLNAYGDNVFVYSTDCFWLDIGNPDDFARSQAFFARCDEHFPPVSAG
jgi:dTDP-glucose pyrophosphorylase